MSVYFEGNAFIEGGQVRDVLVTSSTIQNSFLSGSFGPITTSSLLVTGSSLLLGTSTINSLYVQSNVVIGADTILSGNTTTNSLYATNSVIQYLTTGSLLVSGSTAIFNPGITTGSLYVLQQSLFNSDVTITNGSLLVNNVDISPSRGDIVKERSFAADHNVLSPVNITGFAFDNSTVRSFEAKVSVTVLSTGNTNNKYAHYSILGIQKLNTWDIHTIFAGDNIGMKLFITTAGQLQYTCPVITGFISNTIKFRATTTSM